MLAALASGLAVSDMTTIKVIIVIVIIDMATIGIVHQFIPIIVNLIMAIGIIRIMEIMDTEIMAIHIIRITEVIADHMATPLIIIDMIITIPDTVKTK